MFVVLYVIVDVFSTEKVHEHLQDFFIRSSKVLMDDQSHELKLCLLFVHCMEVTSSVKSLF